MTCGGGDGLGNTERPNKSGQIMQEAVEKPVERCTAEVGETAKWDYSP